RNSSCRDMPVVILTDSNPSPYERHLLEKFGNIHFIKGSPLRRKDLYRAKVESAKRCVVLCDSTRCEQSSDTADAASLMIALNINSLCMDDCFVLVECMYRETFKMIRESDTVKNKQEDYVQALMRPSFMSGNVFTSSSLDTILCQ
ncbi:3647_t:CDS:2, partial [Acaulospora morrowiae]